MCPMRSRRTHGPDEADAIRSAAVRASDMTGADGDESTAEIVSEAGEADSEETGMGLSRSPSNSC